MEPDGFLNHIYKCTQRILFWASLLQPKNSSPIYSIYVKVFHITILCKFPYHILVGNFPLHQSCQRSCPTRWSWYCHADNFWSIVLCSRVLWCSWNNCNIIWGKKMRFVCRALMKQIEHWVVILDTYGSGMAEILWLVFLFFFLLLPLLLLLLIVIIINCNWIFT